MIEGLHHIRLSMPAGGEPDAESFYSQILGITRVPKPEHLEARGGCWFESGDVRIHLGVEEEFRPARKAHPALHVADLELLRRRLESAGVVMNDDLHLPGYDRFYTDDPFGNRIEFLAESD